MLVEVARAMNPRKLSEVMAAMSPEAAARLTVALAGEINPRPARADDSLPAGELPRLPDEKNAAKAAP